MKKIITLIALLIISVSSCDLLGDPFDLWVRAELERVEFMDIPAEDLIGVNSIQDAIDWVGDRIFYRSYEYDNIKSPKKTLEDGFGDCEDYVLLVMNVVYCALGIRMDFAIIDWLHDGTLHAVLLYNGNLYDAQSGCLHYEEVEYLYLFKTAFKF